MTSLSDATNYGFWVAAVNDVGQCAFSTELIQYIPADDLYEPELP